MQKEKKKLTKDIKSLWHLASDISDCRLTLEKHELGQIESDSHIHELVSPLLALSSCSSSSTCKKCSSESNEHVVVDGFFRQLPSFVSAPPF